MSAGAYAEHVPHPALAPWVACYWTTAVDVGPVRAHPVLPDGCIDLLFAVTGAEARLDVVGTMTRAQWVPACGPARFVGVRFRPGGAAAFFGERADLWTDAQPAAADVVGTSARALAGQLTETPDLREALRAIEAFLLARLDVARPVDARIAWAAACLRADPGRRVDVLAADLGVSRQYLRRLFLQHTGVSPRLFGRVARLERLVDCLPRTSLAAAAGLAGYADQAHMTREVKDLVGLTPARYRAFVARVPSVQDGAGDGG